MQDALEIGSIFNFQDSQDSVVTHFLCEVRNLYDARILNFLGNQPGIKF